MSSKKKAILDRIEHLEDDIVKATEYLASGKHADWHGFRPLFVEKVRGGKILPPHKDWIKKVYLPDLRRALKKDQDKLDKLTEKLRDKESG